MTDWRDELEQDAKTEYIVASSGPTDFRPSDVDILLQGLSQTHEAWAHGATLFAAGGFANDQRKRLLSVVACRVRAAWDDATHGKYSEAALDRFAHADTEYGNWLDKREFERAQWLLLDAQRDSQLIKLRALTYIPR